MGARALSDITNVGGGRTNPVEKGKPPKRPQHALQPLAPAAPQPPAPAEHRDITGGYEAHDVEADAQSVQEYASDISTQLFREEAALLAQPDYMDCQTDISAKMRTILIDWLIEVHTKYKLCPETLHLTVNLIDRYLSKQTVMRKRLQLIGVVALMIASKFEDIRPPELHEMVYMTDNAYKKEDLLVMECTMLTTLNFKIMVPTAAHFFEAFQKANGCDPMHREVAQYLLELGLLDMRMLQHTPSHMVAAALLLSNALLKRKCLWPAVMVKQAQHSEQCLQSTADELQQLLDADRAGAGGQLQAVHKKFSATQRHAVANMKF